MTSLEHAPEPLVPAECSMAGNDWFPLHFDRLRKSRWWRRASDLARARNVMLWGEAYKQVPGGSMPDDDDDLAEAAGFGMDVDAFIAAKAEIMGPWVLCSDGRWYHPTVCEVVLEAWEKASERRKAAAAKKASQRAKVRGQAAPARAVPPKIAAVPQDKANVPEDTDEYGRDIGIQYRRGQERTGHPSEPDGSGADAPIDNSDDDEGLDPIGDLRALPLAKGAWRLAVKVLVDQGRMTDPKARTFIGKLKSGGVTDDELWQIAEAAFNEQTEDPQAYLVKASQGVADRRAAIPPAFGPRLRNPPEDQQRAWMRDIREGFEWKEHDRGPKPGQPGCQVSAEIQREFGVDPAKPQPVGGRAA